jgi:hypothetical protein
LLLKTSGLPAAKAINQQPTILGSLGNYYREPLGAQEISRVIL